MEIWYCMDGGLTVDIQLHFQVIAAACLVLQDQIASGNTTGGDPGLLIKFPVGSDIVAFRLYRSIVCAGEGSGLILSGSGGDHACQQGGG